MTQHVCSNQPEVIICQHVTLGNAPVEVLLVSDEGGVDYALCVHCGAAESPEALPMDAICRECAADNHRVPFTMPTPGKWQVAAKLAEVN